VPHIPLSLLKKYEAFEKCLILSKAKRLTRSAYAPEGKTKILTFPMKSPLGQASIH
jgi:hypothetical protein